MTSGMALSRHYWLSHGLPGLEKDFPQLLPHVAAGLLGEGSECMGFDDVHSRDHDWGPGFCLWLPERLYEEYGAPLTRWYETLPREFEGWPVKTVPDRVGIFEQVAFFTRFLGRIPETSLDWLQLPEQYLAVATSGEIFYDPSGRFTSLRNTLLVCPEQVRRKRLAARCVTMMQAGQYNYGRCISRDDSFAAALALREFVLAASSAIFLLNGRWMPFYKWIPRAMSELSRLGALCPLLAELLSSSDGAYQRIEQVCSAVADELRRQNLTELPGCDMQQLGLDIQKQLTDPVLKRLPVMAG